MKVRMDWKTGSFVAIWFLAGVLIYTVIKNWGVAYWWDVKTWQIVAAIATWLLAGGVAFAILQVRQARKSTNAQIAMSLFQELRNPEAIEKLRSIYNLPYDLSTHEGVKELKGHEKKDIDYVLDRFDTLGVLVAEGIIDDKLAIEAYAGPPALRCWYILHHYIKEGRDKRGYFAENYENFARLSLDYFKKEGIQVKLYRDGEKDKVIDLLTELQKDELRPRSLEEIKRDRQIREKDKKEDKSKFKTNSSR